MIPISKLWGRLGNNMFQLAYLYAEVKHGDIPDIYVQDPAYFEDIREEIQAIYGQDIPSKTNQVAIHVRRGDYVNNPFYVDLMKTDYYERAMGLFPNENFLIFSDDPHWCEQYFKANNMEICYEQDEIKSMNLIASCKGIIMANSSFSFWAAYLSKGKVIAPKEWYSDGDTQRTKLPKEWKRI